MYVRRPTSKFIGGPRRGLNGVRGLGRLAHLGDEAPPDPNILFGANPVTQQQFTNAVVGAVNEQVAADNSTLIGPSFSSQASWWLKNSIMGNDPATGKPKTLFGQVIPNWLPVSAGVAVLGAGVVAAGKRR